MITVNHDGSVIADIEEKILFEDWEAGLEAQENDFNSFEYTAQLVQYEAELEAELEAAALPMVYDVKIFCGAAAYACISYDYGKFDIKLGAGKGAVQSLHEYAAEQKQRAAELLSKAELATQAAQFLSEKGKGLKHDKRNRKYAPLYHDRR